MATEGFPSSVCALAKLDGGLLATIGSCESVIQVWNVFCEFSQLRTCEGPIEVFDLATGDLDPEFHGPGSGVP